MGEEVDGNDEGWRKPVWVSPGKLKDLSMSELENSTEEVTIR